MKPAKTKAGAEKLALFEKLVAAFPGVERKGATMPYTSLNGHMFSLLTPEGTLALRLPESERNDFLRTYQTTLVKQYGVIMKEYVAVPDDLLGRTKELAKHFKVSLGYVGGLKPKPTTKKPKAAPAAPSASAKPAAKRRAPAPRRAR